MARKLRSVQIHEVHGNGGSFYETPGSAQKK